MGIKFGKDVKHILDCPESNLPILSRSKANFWTERLKTVCPLLFPTIPAKNVEDEIETLATKANAFFAEIKADVNLDLN